MFGKKENKEEINDNNPLSLSKDEEKKDENVKLLTIEELVGEKKDNPIEVTNNIDINIPSSEDEEKKEDFAIQENVISIDNKPNKEEESFSININNTNNDNKGNLNMASDSMVSEQVIEGVPLEKIISGTTEGNIEIINKNKADGDSKTNFEIVKSSEVINETKNKEEGEEEK